MNQEEVSHAQTEFQKEPRSHIQNANQAINNLKRKQLLE